MKPVLLVQSSQQYAAKPKNSAGMQKMLFLTFSSQTANQAIPSGGDIGHLCMHLVQARADVLHGKGHAMMLLITPNGTQTD